MAIASCAGCGVRCSHWALIAAVGVFLTADAGLLAGDEPAPRTDLHGDPLPAGAVVRLGTSRFRNEGGISGLVFAADGRSLFVAAPDGYVAVLEVATGRRVRELSTGGQSIAGLWLGPNHQSILTFGEEFDDKQAARIMSVKSWGSATGEALARIPIIDVATVFGTAFGISRDGKLIVTGNQRGTLAVSDVATGKLLAKLIFDRLSMQTVAVSPDGKLVVAAARNDLIFWEWQTEEAPVQMRLGRNVHTLAFSADGTLLAEGPDSRKDVVVRDVASRTVLRTFSDPNSKGMTVTGLAFSADGKSLVATNAVIIRGQPTPSRINVWDVATGEIRRQFSTGAVTPWSLALSEDGHWLAARVAGSRFVGPGGSIAIWDLRTGEPVGDDLPSHMTEITAILYSSDGRTIVTAGQDGTVRVWGAETGRQTQVLRHEERVLAASLSPDGALIASSSNDNTVRLWETATGRELHRFAGHGDHGGRQAVAFSSDGERFASWGDDDLFLRIRDVKTGAVVSERRVHPSAIPPPNENEDMARRDQRLFDAPITGVRFSADAKRLAIHLAGKTYLFDGMTGEELDVLESPEGRVSALDLALPADGTRLATSALERVGGGNPRDFRGPGAPRTGRQIIRVREFATGREVFQVALPEWDLGPIAFSADGRSVAVAGRAPAGKVRVLDAATGEVSAEFDGPRQLPHALAFSPDGKRLACGLSDGTALIWDLSQSPPPKP